VRTLPLLLLLLACDGTRPQGSYDPNVLGRGLPPGFWFGAATAAHQIEGGTHNDWTEWEAIEGHIKNGDSSHIACNSWEQWPEDIQALEQLGANAYRLGIEWSRVEPEEDRYDAVAIARYRTIMQMLRARHIVPVVTLFHFTLPLWLSARGGFEDPSTIEAFANFAARMGQELGDQIDVWVTVNEANVYALEGYNAGIWPPGVKDGKRQTIVYANLIRAHAAASRALRENDQVDADGDGKATFIGLAHHVRIFQPASSALLDQTITALSDDYFNESLPRALHDGKIQMSIPGTYALDVHDDTLVGTTDWLGLNYYTRDHVRADLGSATLSQQYVPQGRPQNDLGWEIYPEGLTDVLVRYARFGWPLLITENGIADQNDAKRSEFLQRHVFAIETAVRAGVDVRGYLHWSLMDNFEWAEGYAGKFGLFAIDFNDSALRRTPRPSVATFRAMSGNIPPK
jgi:beta-glucosidase